ncbi:MAG: hypothetical protein ABFR33_10255 [Verrucomicrobiota bacterium]
MKRTGLAAGLIMATMAAQAATVLFSEDFEGYALGQVTNASQVGAYAIDNSSASNGVTRLEVALEQSASAPYTVGDAEDNCLRISDYSETDDGAFVHWQSAQSAATGTLTLDFAGQDLNEGTLNMRVMSGGAIACYLRVHNGSVYLYDGADYSATLNTYTEGATHKVVITFDAGTDTWSATLDGVAIERSGGDASFGFYNGADLPFVDGVKLVSTGIGAWRGNTYVDDISLVGTSGVQMNYIVENFEDRAITPTFSNITSAAEIGAYWVNTPISYLSVVQDGSSSAIGTDVFGAGNDKYLRISDYSTVTNSNPADDGTAAWWNSSTSLVSGALSVDFIVQDYQNGYVWFELMSGSTTALHFRVYSGLLHTYTSLDPEDLQFTQITNACAEGVAHSLLINFDAAADTFSGMLDGVPLSDATGGTSWGFDANVSVDDIDGVLVRNGTEPWRANCYVDNILLYELGDSDEDGLPDAWELQWFGNLDTGPADFCANGIDTVGDAYIAGFDPADPFSLGFVATIANATGSAVIQWTETADGVDRIYTIKWTDDLVLTPFTTLDTYEGGAYTDTVHAADTEGFYKLEADVQ